MITLVNPTLPYAFARRHGVVLLDAGEIAIVGLREDADPLALIETRRALGRPLKVERMARGVFERALSDIYADEGLSGSLDMPAGLEGLAEDLPATADLLDGADDAPVIRLINGVVAEAARAGASDIHFEPYETLLRVRMRVDGVLREMLTLDARVTPLLASRIKVMARLDIAERRLPQDGRIALSLGGRALDVRVSTLPARAGERVVMRILDRDQAGLGLADLGMDPGTLDVFRRSLSEPNGIVLVTGPTGSGKTTSLYAGLSLLNDGSRNILTVEDPVEYAVEGVGQTQVNARVGMTFAAGLRAILRQDPDVVMVGEIRDAETASIAVQAALTGHLVLSTVHTNDAAGAVVRLRDIGVESFLLASTLRLVAAQRLVRRLCPRCRRAEPADAAVARLAGIDLGETVWRPAGCEACDNTGYVGRVGLYEVMAVDDRIRRLVAAGADEHDIRQAAFAGGGTLGDQARRAVREGVTSVEEAVRAARQDAPVAEAAA
ncbi:type II secretion system protein GspE [Brevundimonas sp. S30B]|uniref:type II secretion system ATPase GspE n=1 Tax=unclassified Brevundimonas TaxID=2622653 RepID=UPI001071CEE6|nr:MULTISPECIES: type II secretion system ATPase GspE [unclassified Brevundimonas]QBX38376.1 type II secretion system protein GspE [Brevundimonas sp. MF30-B]TFW02084.1 type II secretion system protein GspE [Brevundimonas sp. S30B]